MFTCNDCGSPFAISPAARKKYPNWTPKQCANCRPGRKTARKRTPADSTEDVLTKFDAGPQFGVFTDGSCTGNPGPGGWGAVKVADGAIIDERHGHEPLTTNNQMELRALIEAYRMLDPGETAVIYSDSLYCVKTINIWAAGWEDKGWKTTSGPVKNLDLVQELLALARTNPNATVSWIRGHDGSKWNEYADALARRPGP